MGESKNIKKDDKNKLFDVLIKINKSVRIPPQILGELSDGCGIFLACLDCRYEDGLTRLESVIREHEAVLNLSVNQYSAFGEHNGLTNNSNNRLSGVSRDEKAILWG